MPISIREYKDELDSGESRILAILEKQPYQAYTLSELMEQNVKGLALTILYILATQAEVTNLIEKGLVKSKLVRGIIHYVSSKAI